ncbi:MAG: sensor histidine kinase [Clostridia bacterium]|nr:sensor histidine kinase [Clostridia bacterium]
MKKLIKGFYKHSLTRKTAIVSIIVSVVTVGLACNFTYQSIRESSVENAAKQVSQTINQLSDKLNDNVLYIYDLYAKLEIDRDFVNISSKQNGKFDLEDFSLLSQLFNDTHVLNSEIIDSIVFVRYDGQIFYEYRNGINESVDYRELDWFKKASSNNGFAIWYPPYRNELFFNVRKDAVGFMKAITNSIYKQTGVLVMNINTSYFRNELAKLNIGSETELFIVDAENNIIASAKDSTEGCKEILKLLEEDDIPDTLYYKNRKTHLISSEIGNMGWRVMEVIPESELTVDVDALKLWIFTAIFTGVIITLTLMLFVLKKITIPLNKLTNVMQMTDGKTGKRIRYTGKENERRDEIGYLAQSYNIMIDNIDELMEQIKKKNEEESKAQLRALQQQINSHFLYNTLDTIYWKVMDGDKTASADMIKRLSTYFRLALNKGDDVTTVYKEIQHIENYVAIEKYRYKNKIEYRIEVDEEIYEFKLPKLLIQPLVENAIVHGVFTRRENSLVTVTGRQLGENIVFTVEDNGVGMDIDVVEKYVKSNEKSEKLKNSFALRNIYTRIKLYYKESGDMEFYINEYGGAGIRVILPANLPDDTEEL